MSIDAKKLRELIKQVMNAVDVDYIDASRSLQTFLFNNAPAIADLADEVERLRKALEWYADEQNYQTRPYGTVLCERVVADGGNIARTALAKPANGGEE